MTEPDDIYQPPRDLLDAYALAPPAAIAPFARQGVNNTLHHITTGAGEFLLKTYRPSHTAASLAYEHRLLERLAEAQLPFAVPAPLPRRDGRLLSQTDRGRAALVPLLPGTSPDPKNLDHVARMGAALAALHEALGRRPARPRPGRPLFEALLAYPPARFDPLRLTARRLGLAGDARAEALLAWWREEAARLRAYAEGEYRALPWQICHNDITPANMLMLGGRVSAVLDFEFACPAPRALDLAMGLRMTMRVWENPEPWPAARSFLAGYAARQPVSPAELRALPGCIRLRSAMAILWRLGHMEAPGDAQIVLRHIEYQQNAVAWLEREGARLVEVAADAARA